MKVPENKRGYAALLKKIGVEPELANQASSIRARGGSRTNQEREVMKKVTRFLVNLVEDEINRAK